MFGGRYAEPAVICVEVGTQVDLLAYDEELVDDLNSQLLQPELVALAGLFGRFPEVRARKTVIAKEVIQTGLVKKENLDMWVHGHSMRMLTTSSGEAHGDAELVTVRRGVANGQACGAPLRWGSYERTRWFADAVRSPWRGVVIRSLTCVKMHVHIAHTNREV